MRPWMFCFPLLPALLFSGSALGSPPEDLLSLGWEYQPEIHTRWVRDFEGPEAEVRQVEAGTLFELRTPHSAQSWTLTVPPIWTRDFPAVDMTWTITGAHEQRYTGMFLRDGSTGPVTPGANNPENPLSSGNEATVSIGGPSGPDEGGLTANLLVGEKLDRVSEIRVVVRSAEGPAQITLNSLRFLQRFPYNATLAERLTGEESGRILRAYSMPHEGEDARRTSWPELVLESPETERVFAPLTVPNATVPLAAAAEALEVRVTREGAERVLAEGLPFALGETGAAVTPIQAGGELVLEVGEGSGGGLALLLGTRLFGSTQPWYGGGLGAARTETKSALEARVELEYSDGTGEQVLPLRQKDLQPGFAAGLHAYTVAIAPSKTLERVRLVDAADHVQLLLLAASRLPEMPPHTAREELSQLPLPPPLEQPWQNWGGGWSNMVLNLKFGSENGLQLTSLGVPDEVLREPLRLIEILDEAKLPLPLELVWKRDGNAYEWQGPQQRLLLRVDIEYVPFNQLRISPVITANINQVITVRCPVLKSLRFSEGNPVEYLLGTRTPLLSGSPREVEELYGAGYLLQLFDAHDARKGGGLGVIIEDDQLLRKWFQFRHGEDESSDFAVEYRDLHLKAGENLALPPFLLAPHLGDWHTTFDAYRTWTRKAFPAPENNPMTDQFWCRRDYPLGGTGHLYDLHAQRYSPERLMAESTAGFGGIDLIDISSWAYNEQTGRVGNYVENELGGLPELGRAADVAHAAGTAMGLYFEGYLVDKRTPLAAQALPAWQLIKQDGTGMWWSGEMEFFCCPGVPAWRDALIAQVVQVAVETGVDAVYLDQLGNTGTGKECWSKDHGHGVPSNPLVEEREMIRQVRAALKQRGLRTALYIEHVPADALAHLVDGAFNISIANETDTHPTRLPLQRFVFPHIAIFEMLAHGIRPVPADAAGLNLALFNGLGLWLKGRADSWFSAEFQRLAREAYPVFKEHAALLRSADCTPLIPTRHPGLYANEFRAGNVSLVTIFNAGPRTCTGELVAMEGPVKTVETLLGQHAMKMGEDRIITGQVEPGEMAAVLVRREE